MPDEREGEEPLTSRGEPEGPLSPPGEAPGKARRKTPEPPPPPTVPPPSAGAASWFWFTGWPGWFDRVLLVGLIQLIPIVGSMVMLGWILTVRESLIQGASALPPAGFSYLRRGAKPFLALLLWFLLLVMVLIAGFVVADVLSFGGLAVAARVVVYATALVVIAGSVYVLYLEAAILLRTDRGGVLSGLDIAGVRGAARANRGASAYLMWALLAAAAATYLLSRWLGFFGGEIGLVLDPIFYLAAVPRLTSFALEP